jgi:hypothetical protein
MVANGYRCEVAADGEVAAADRGAKRNVRLEACRTAAPVQVNADFHGIREAADRCQCTIRTVRISISLAGKRSLQGSYVAAGLSVERATVRIDLI